MWDDVFSRDGLLRREISFSKCNLQKRRHNAEHCPPPEPLSTADIITLHEWVSLVLTSEGSIILCWEGELDLY